MEVIYISSDQDDDYDCIFIHGWVSSGELPVFRLNSYYIKLGVKLARYANICSLPPPPTLSIQNVSLSSIVSLVHCCNWLRKDWLHLHNVSGINYLLDNCSLSEGFSKQSVSVICKPNSLWVMKLWFSSIARQNFPLLSGCWTRAACDWMIFRERL